LNGWQFWVDRGGTFTDVVAQTPQGVLRCHKLLSENPKMYPDAAIQAIRDLLGIEKGTPMPAEAIRAVKMGTTVATNALLERRGEPTLLVITKGFGDLLRIGDQHRPELFSLAIRKPEVLYREVLEVEERITASGEVIQPLDVAQAKRGLREAHERGLRAVAIVCLHAYRYPDHEKKLAELAREAGFDQVSTSHETSALIKMVNRGETTVVDAYLSPILQRYVARVSQPLEGVPLWFMQSNGGLVASHLFRGKDSVLSGPAGGIVGAVKTCVAAGFEKVITFDMGGTSTDVAHYRGSYERTTERVIAGVRIGAPMMEIHTVAAGGGSILSFDGSKMAVGPDSAGALPGPACYGRGGPLTVTDANLLLGRLVPASFPNVFGEDGKSTLDREAVSLAFETLSESWRKATGSSGSIQSLAEGALKIAVYNMAQAIKKISVQRGYDPADYALCVFGGAAGQLACAVADVLGMNRIFIHPFSGVLSAYGMGLAEPRVLVSQTLELPWNESSWGKVRQWVRTLTANAETQLVAQGVAVDASEARIGLRYSGSDQVLMVAYDSPEAMRLAFETQHRAQFGFLLDNQAVVIASVAVESSGPIAEAHGDAMPNEAWDKLLPATTRLWSEGQYREVPLWAWSDLGSGQEIKGPAMVVSSHATIVVEAGWKAVNQGHLTLTRETERSKAVVRDGGLDPVRLEIFNSAFMSIAEQMGFTLQKTAASVNMKERLDFSCALFDGKGSLIANAPHMPVHLGSMGESVRALIRTHGTKLRPGDAYASNNPYRGGTHLPDITVISPIFDREGQRLVAFVAARGHHADVGGLTPGSMPPFSKHIEDEGVLLDNEPLVEEGRFCDEGILAKLTTGRQPSRNPQQNLADLQAQLAALAKGISEFNALVERQSLQQVEAYMGFVQDYAEASVKRLLPTLRSGRFQLGLDQGGEVRVEVRIDSENDRAIVDFSGTSPQRPDNFNAPSAVCRAAVLYVFRCLIREQIPLNEGCLRPIEIIIPEGSMLAPTWPAAVVAGNVETSQVITDALFGALGIMAAAQGTMNNFTFGNQTYQYYETIAGGSGAGEGFDGADGVQSHMTNSRITDPEILELRFPVLLEAFSVRRGSGGRGRNSGGNGLLRRFYFREAMTAAILANRRRIPPFGLEGGSPGALGSEQVWKGARMVGGLNGLGEIELEAGDRLEIRTPGGGGYGRPAEE